MSAGVVSFDEIRDLVTSALDSIGPPKDATAVFVVRDIFGKIGLSASENARSDALVDWLDRLARALEERLGAHGRPAERASLWIEPELLDEMRDTALPIRPGVFWTDRLLTGENWWTVGEERPQREPARYTLHSVEGGMGRSTAATVLAWHLARRGERVLAVDLDIESPGLASAVLDEVQPKFGVVDWFVEELVGQGDAFLPDMVATPAWASDLPGAVWIAPAHGRDPGEYLPKLGRVYADTIADPWIARLQRLLGNLEAALKPTVVVVDAPAVSTTSQPPRSPASEPRRCSSPWIRRALGPDTRFSSTTGGPKDSRP